MVTSPAALDFSWRSPRLPYAADPQRSCLLGCAVEAWNDAGEPRSTPGELGLHLFHSLHAAVLPGDADGSRCTARAISETYPPDMEGIPEEVT